MIQLVCHAVNPDTALISAAFVAWVFHFNTTIFKIVLYELGCALI